MSTLLDATARITAILEEIDRLKQSDFPYSHPHEVLELLETRFKRHLSVLEKIPANTSNPAVHNLCRESLRELMIYIPILGFVLRATNVRNAFEEIGPLQRFASNVIDKDTKLIISSEWEFSPFVYRAIKGLSGFVLIGFPASESSNPLILPLSGHEMAHSIWKHDNLGLKYEKHVENQILDEVTVKRWKEYSSLYSQYQKEDVKGQNWLAKLTWRPAYSWAILQIEEMFCDFMGLRMFEEAYLHAFAYLLSPGKSGQRSLRYPNIKRRVSHLSNAAKRLHIPISEYYVAEFADEDEPADPTTALLVSIADTVSSSLEGNLIDLVVDIANKRNIPRKLDVNVEKIIRAFSDHIVPVSEPTTIIDLVNAGWRCYLNEHIWEKSPQIKGNNESFFSKNKNRVLRDIMLKSLEITEYYERVGGN